MLLDIVMNNFIINLPYFAISRVISNSAISKFWITSYIAFQNMTFSIRWTLGQTDYFCHKLNYWKCLHIEIFHWKRGNLRFLVFKNVNCHFHTALLFLRYLLRADHTAAWLCNHY